MSEKRVSSVKTELSFEGKNCNCLMKNQVITFIHEDFIEKKTKQKNKKKKKKKSIKLLFLYRKQIYVNINL